MAGRRELPRAQAISELARLVVPRLTDAERLDLLAEWEPVDTDPTYASLSPAQRRAMTWGPWFDLTRDQPGYEAVLCAASRCSFRGVRNEYVQSRLVGEGFPEDLDVCGEPERLEPCQCCGYRTLERAAWGDVCPVCYWDWDNAAPTERSGPNYGLTLEEAQANYREFGAFSKEVLEYVDKEGPAKYLR